MYTVPKLDDYSPQSLDRAVADLFAALDSETSALQSEADWKTFRDRWLARKNGVLTQVNDTWLKAAPGPSKREVGQRVNELKARAEAAIEEAQNKLHASSAGVEACGRAPRHHTPRIQRPIGVKHPVLRVMDEIVAVFKAMGYSVGEGPEVETDYYNFESLNFPPNHPARDTQDTLFIAGQEQQARRAIVCCCARTPRRYRSAPWRSRSRRCASSFPARCTATIRWTPTHSPVFHQVEGLAVDENITFCDLKGTLDHAMKALLRLVGEDRASIRRSSLSPSRAPICR